MKILSIIALFFIIGFSYNLAGEYHVDKSKSNLVKFISNAPLEDFEGVTDKIDGYIYWPADDMFSDSELYIEVDLNALDTGIGLRNRHMRENYLETDQYPITHFNGKLVRPDTSVAAENKVMVKGQLFIHGVTRDVQISGSMIPVGNGYHITSDFIVSLPEYNIQVPQFMFLKIDEEMQIKLDFYVIALKEDE